MLKRWRRLGLGLLVLTMVILGAQPSPGQATDADPLAGHGVVYVLRDDQWREALLRLAQPRTMAEPTMVDSAVEGAAPGLEWRYLVEYLDGQPPLREAQVARDRIRTLQQAQDRGLTTNVYDLTTTTGIEQILALHNDLRQQVGVTPLAWSDDLAASAQAWANTLLAENAFYHSPARRRRRGTVGENLHQRQGPPGWSYATPQRALSGWIGEQAHYTYATNRCAPGQQCGHYLQMVWHDTRRVGCAMARTEDARREVWACHYYPGGIVPGQRPY